MDRLRIQVLRDAGHSLGQVAGFESSPGSHLDRPRNWPTHWFTEAQVLERSWASLVSPALSTTYAVTAIPPRTLCFKTVAAVRECNQGVAPGAPSRILS